MDFAKNRWLLAVMLVLAFLAGGLGAAVDPFRKAHPVWAWAMVIAAALVALILLPFTWRRLKYRKAAAAPKCMGQRLREQLFAGSLSEFQWLDLYNHLELDECEPCNKMMAEEYFPPVEPMRRR